jgi:hypothetical protein
LRATSASNANASSFTGRRMQRNGARTASTGKQHSYGSSVL